MEQEFKDRVSRLAQAKKDLDEMIASTGAAQAEKQLVSDSKLVESETSSSAPSMSLDSDTLKAKHLSDTLGKVNLSSSSSPLESGPIDSLPSNQADSKDDIDTSIQSIRADRAEVKLNVDNKLADNESHTSDNENLLNLQKGPLSTTVARPHHLPKMESLSTKLEEMRRNMSVNQEEGDEAPWDTSGKPKMKKKKSKRKDVKNADEEDGISSGTDFCRAENNTESK